MKTTPCLRHSPVSGHTGSKRKNDRLAIDEDKKSYYMFIEITLMKTVAVCIKMIKIAATLCDVAHFT